MARESVLLGAVLLLGFCYVGHRGARRLSVVPRSTVRVDAQGEGFEEFGGPFGARGQAEPLCCIRSAAPYLSEVIAGPGGGVELLGPCDYDFSSFSVALYDNDGNLVQGPIPLAFSLKRGNIMKFVEIDSMPTSGSVAFIYKADVVLEHVCFGVTDLISAKDGPAKGSLCLDSEISPSGVYGFVGEEGHFYYTALDRPSKNKLNPGQSIGCRLEPRPSRPNALPRSTPSPTPVPPEPTATPLPVPPAPEPPVEEPSVDPTMDPSASPDMFMQIF
mmetsp:Transcript_38382/g.94033  ORF Transcript_38382/g.94033 Transcript_38382/m.94033 type:complete len:274 (-) Transcript_38382:704-1525(-)|eukprot:CAMPEP_0198326364 /NCGR_PEP_ID=MMETSP1450-20131203/13908_1 /TAXON_ID=753684 ORGANISM="Madagascaria erythrocladiodes, Strain CCMP3234" /NCGR_SAMPLE_ID=MMETSP1450 /ASSEMBLY_ACC=CAM_ASM_001115 /LENGTH=273 /DNA_ID=CAMNT_0044030325 /DNA_START=585 /DNA_END=1409 /DNA_ORIENTATION=-